MRSLKTFLCSCIVFVVRVYTQAINNLLSVAVTNVNKFQTTIALKVVPKSTKIAYITV